LELERDVGGARSGESREALRYSIGVLVLKSFAFPHFLWVAAWLALQDISIVAVDRWAKKIPVALVVVNFSRKMDCMSLGVEVVFF